MRKVVIVVFVLVGILALLLLVVGAGIGVVSWLGKGRVPGRTVLEVDFEQGLVEYVPDDPLSKVMFGKRLSVRDVVDALEKASSDDRVHGLIARVGSGSMGVAQIQEVRDALIAFRESGKPAIAYAETFGEVGPGNGAYYLATAFEEIYLQPSGDLGLTGLIIEHPFLRGTLEKLGMSPRMDHRHEFKNAKNFYTEKGFTPAHREAEKALMDSIFGQIVRAIADCRGMGEEEVRALVDGGPFYGQEAVDAGLVDGLAYRDEVYARVRENAGVGARFLYLARYLGRAGRPHTRGETIALVYGVGAVTRGESEYDPVFGSVSMGSDTVAGALRTAVEDDDVRAIVFRVNSPGGSYVASDAIWRETVRAKEAGKPVIVTMGDVAASGGYFVSMWADRIVVQPGTITGSIGVLGGKFLTEGFWEKVGLSWDEVHTSENATVWSGLYDYSPAEWARFQDWLDRVYTDFTGKVAEGRGMPRERVLEIAKGRVWTGEDAKELGLVDDFGGFRTAFRLAREAAGLEPDAKIRIRVFPRPRSPFQAWFGEGAESSEPTASALARVLETVQPVARLARRVGLAGSPGPLSAEAYEGALR